MNLQLLYYIINFKIRLHKQLKIKNNYFHK